MLKQPYHQKFSHPFLPGLLLAIGLILWGGCANAQDKQSASSAQTAPIFEHNFITLETFENLRTQGATVLDVRPSGDFAKSHVPGAVNITWESFVDGEKNGEVSPNDQRLNALLQNAGVRQNQPVIIYGNWSDKSAWGEEGRVLWTLQYLGKKDVFILQGGFQGWKKADLHEKGSKKIEKGDFSIKRHENLRISTSALQKLLAENSENLVVLDTRERIEYHGVPKYGEDRGGHIPGARHMWWYDVFSKNGNLKSKSELNALFSSRGISKDSQIVVYCTGGIRSGFVFTVLQALGYKNIKNYDASMWAWTAQENTPLNRIQK